MDENALPKLADFRKKAIKDLDDLRQRYIDMVKAEEEAKAEQSKIQKFERAVRLLPGLLKVEENLLSSAQKEERRLQLEENLQPLFAVLSKVLGSRFDENRQKILAELEAKLELYGD